MVAIVVATIGAIGTVISAWLVHVVRQVRTEVDGHTSRLEARIAELEGRSTQER